MRAQSGSLASACYILIRDLFTEVGPRLTRVPSALLVSGFRFIRDEVQKLFARQDASSENYIERAIQESYDAAPELSDEDENLDDR